MDRAAGQPESVLKIRFPGSLLQVPGPGKPLQPKTSQPILRALSSSPNDFPGPLLASAQSGRLIMSHGASLLAGG